MHEKEELFWELVAPHLEGPAERGTMMGNDCLRVGGDFTAMVSRKTHDLIIKLPADRVLELIDDGQVESFSPNGKVFKEWALVPGDDPDQWTALLAEAVAARHQ